MAVWSIVDFSSAFKPLRFDAEYWLPQFLAFDKLADKTGGPIKNYIKQVIQPSEFLREYDSLPGSPEFWRAQNIKRGYINRSNAEFIDSEIFSTIPNAQVREGDILIVRTGANAGDAATVPRGINQVAVSSHTLRVIPNDIATGYALGMFFACDLGRSILNRLVSGSTRPQITKEMIEGLIVPDFSSIAQELADRTLQYYEVKDESTRLYVEAENLVLHALQLDKLAVASKTYTAPFSDFTRTLRLDAQYYQPRYQQTLDRLGKSGLTIANVAQPVRTRFRPVTGTTFQYLEIGGLLDGGRVEPEPIAAEEAPSRAQTVLQVGDVVTSSVRPIRRLTGFIGPEQGGTVGTSGFIALRPTAVAPEVLTVYLRLPIVCEILDLYTTATMYPTITEADVLKLPFPTLSPEVQREIVLLVQAGFAARQRATELLDEAKRRVEQYIKAA